MLADAHVVLLAGVVGEIDYLVALNLCIDYIYM